MKMEMITQMDGVAGGVLAIIIFLILIAVLRTLIRVCPSNHILVVTGGTETVVEGKKIRLPSSKRRLDLRRPIRSECPIP